MAEELHLNSTDTLENYKADHNLSQTFYVSMAIALMIIIAVSTSSNVLLIFVIATCRKLHSIAHVFMANLIAIDIMTTVLVIPFHVNFMLNDIFTHSVVMCGTMQATFLMAIPVAVLSLLLLTVERFIRIALPSRVQQIFTTINILALSGTTWVCALSSSLYPILSDPDSLYFEQGYCDLHVAKSYIIYLVSVLFLLPNIGIFFLHITIFFIAKKQEQKLKQAINGTHKQQRRKLLSFRRGARRVALLVALRVFCSLPCVAMDVWKILHAAQQGRLIWWITVVLKYLSASISPILYSALNATVQKEILNRYRHLSGFSKQTNKQKYQLSDLQSMKGNQAQGISSRRSSMVL